jgi:hypothetical protein
MISRRLVARMSLLAVVVAVLGGCSTTPIHAVPGCPGSELSLDPLILVAQAVPSATFAPCIQEFPIGWNFGGQEIQTGRAEFWLDSDRGGVRAVTVTLTPGCDVSEAVEIPPEADALGMRQYELPRLLPPSYEGDRFYVFEGGCIRYRFAFQNVGTYNLVVEATEALGFVDRELGVVELRKEGLILCGAGAPDCAG